MCVVNVEDVEGRMFIYIFVKEKKREGRWEERVELGVWDWGSLAVLLQECIMWRIWSYRRMYRKVLALVIYSLGPIAYVLNAYTSLQRVLFLDS